MFLRLCFCISVCIYVLLCLFITFCDIVDIVTYCFVFNIFDIVPNTFKIYSPGTSAQQDPIQNEVVDDIENEDPVQRVMDGGSDDEMDDELESDDNDSVLNIVAPTWCITTSGMRPLQLTRTNELLVPVP